MEKGVKRFIPAPVPHYRPESVQRMLADFRLTLRKLLFSVVNPLIPYEGSPGPPTAELPEIAASISAEQLAQCQAMFDQCEARRDRLEKKAQWIFTVLAFLVPATVSLSVYLSRDGAAITKSPLLAIAYLVATVLLVLSFVSAARAMAVRPGDYPFVQAVIDGESGVWKSYAVADHVRLVLWCTLQNTKTNDHIAQFVKGAHSLMVISVLLLVLVGATEMSLRLLDQPSSSRTSVWSERVAPIARGRGGTELVEDQAVSVERKGRWALHNRVAQDLSGLWSDGFHEAGVQVPDALGPYRCW